MEREERERESKGEKWRGRRERMREGGREGGREGRRGEEGEDKNWGLEMTVWRIPDARFALLLAIPMALPPDSSESKDLFSPLL